MNVFRGRILEASKFAVISDVHLRSLEPTGIAASDGVTADEVAELIADLRRSGHCVIVNGDLFDMDRAALPFGHRTEFERLRASNEGHPLWAELADERVVLLSGNHDARISGLLRAYQVVDIISGDVRVRIEHGERFDAWIKRVRPFTSLVTWLSGVTETFSLGAVTRALRFVERTTTGSDEGDHRIQRRVQSWLGSHPHYDGLIFGHTHEPEIAAGPAGVLVNSGQSMRWPINVARVDLNARSVQLQTRDKRGSIERLVSKPFTMRQEGCESPSRWRKMASELGILLQDGE